MTLLSRAPATTELYTLSLHDALPIFEHRRLLGPGGLPLGDGLAEELGVGLDDVEIQAANLGLLIGVHLLEAGQHVLQVLGHGGLDQLAILRGELEIGRASCRERVWGSVV